MPNLSYDLNEDGNISDKEYFLGRRFDRNSDGMLEPNERKLLMKALHNNYEKQFIWGLERFGKFRGQRIVQIRGKIADSGDYSSICDTYPKHPISLNKSTCLTLSELKNLRKKHIMYYINNYIEKN